MQYMGFNRYNHVGIKMNNKCTMWCPEKQTNVDVVHVVLTYMGKFHVRNVTESRDFQYLRVVVRKDVAPCGGLRPKSFIKNLVSPQLLLRFAIFVYQKILQIATKNYFYRLGSLNSLILETSNKHSLMV